MNGLFRRDIFFKASNRCDVMLFKPCIFVGYMTATASLVGWAKCWYLPTRIIVTRAQNICPPYKKPMVYLARYLFKASNRCDVMLFKPSILLGYMTATASIVVNGEFFIFFNGTHGNIVNGGVVRHSFITQIRWVVVVV